MPDAVATAKTRGSAQRIFAKAVKDNCGNRCAITGISTKAFLVASHIVPWAVDENIRTDPANGVCLSTLVDRAFDAGYLSIAVDRRVTINSAMLTEDMALWHALIGYNGVVLEEPSSGAPNPAYLQRRLDLE